MRNVFKRTIVSMIAAVMLVVMVPHSAEAKNIYGYKATELKQNTWAATKPYSYKKEGSDWHFTYDALKVTVPSDGYVKIDSKDKNDEIFISKASELVKFQYTVKLSGSTTYYRVIPKGTYLMWTDNKDSGINVRFKFVKSADAGNYDRTRATSVASGKKTTVVFTDGHEYSKWYKIKLNKKKAITISTNIMDENTAGIKDYMKVFSSNGTEVKLTEKVKNKTYQSKTLNKGTYYIKIDYPYSWSDPWSNHARIQSFSWK